MTLARLGWACSLLSCSPATEPTGQLRASVFGGEDSGPVDDAVVSLKNPERNCSAVLVAPHLILTALQCVSTLKLISGFSCSPRGEVENGGNGAGEIGEPYPAEQLRVSVGESPSGEPRALGARVIGSGSTAVCHDNLAFVVLDRPLPEVPVAPLRLDIPVQFNESVSVIGYGTSELGTTEPRRRRRDAVRVTDVGVPPRTFATGTGPCGADVGGPAISGEGAVLGVLAVFTEPCGIVSSAVYTQVASFAPFVRRSFEVADAEHWLPPEVSDSPPHEPPSGGCSVHWGSNRSWSEALWLVLAAVWGARCLRRRSEDGSENRGTPERARPYL